ncbi:MAG: GTP-binding protein [Clostridiales bacterium]|nr:GTP-binding protein [Clostridiales bacterium]
MAKVDIFSGFLGAGKTTLIKKLVEEAYKGEQVVLIENEFGEIGIDGGFLKDSGIQINEMNAGCICCSLVGDFSKSLEQVLEQFHPDRILIEPSGVGKLSDIVEAVERLDDPDLQLNGFTTVVDAKKAKVYMKNFGEFYNNQVEHASAIILSHTKGMAEDKLKAVVELMRAHNDHATIITTDWDQLDGKQILNAMENKDTLQQAIELLEKEHEEHHDHDHHHDHDDDDDDDHDEHEHHHHDHDDDDENEQEHHHHHHDHDDDDNDDDEHEHHHHHHHDHDDDDEHEHHHHHHDHDEEECDDPECSCHHHHHHHDGHHHADEVFDSYGYETAKKYSPEFIKECLDKLGDFGEYGQILRAKGIVEGEDGQWIHFDYVPGEPDVRFGSAEVTGRIVVIGAGVMEDSIKELFGL